jgi:uncharacterized repeat protein (TIGR03803 family)
MAKNHSLIYLSRPRHGAILALLIGLGLVASAAGQPAFQRLTQLFPGSNQGAYPLTTLAEGQPGVFFGTTTDGGSNTYGSASGYGTIFSVTAAGLFSNLGSFNLTNGSRPTGGLTLGDDGAFYGITASGGPGFFEGTLFRVTTNGTLSMVATFGGPNGTSPNGPLAKGVDGSLYGTTSQGGARGLGTFFRCTPGGQLTTLYSFDGTNGANPSGGLIPVGDGTFAGVTYGGGAGYPSANFGTVFRITASGVVTAVHSLAGTNGTHPNAPLVVDAHQNIYGTAQTGGTYGKGTIFGIGPDGIVRLVASFDGTNGYEPFGGLTLGQDDYLYGTTAYRNENSLLTNGTIFRASTNGAIQTILRMDGTNGSNGTANMLVASDGNLYGAISDITKSPGADGNVGTLFRLVAQPRITSIATSNATIRLSWSTFPGGVYQVESRSLSAIGAWAMEGNLVNSTGRTTAVEMPQASTSRAFRVGLLP